MAREQDVIGYIISVLSSIYVLVLIYANLNEYWRRTMDTLIFGLFFLALFFHAVQWYLQIKALGGNPVWFKIFKKS